MRPQPRPPAIWGRRSWKAYLVANPSVTQVGKDSSGTIQVDNSRGGGDSPDSTATVCIKL